MLRCYTLMTECTKAPAMYENSMRCSAMHLQHVGSFAPDGGISQLNTVRFSNKFQYNDGHFTSFHLIYMTRHSQLNISNYDDEHCRRIWKQCIGSS